MSKFKLSNKAVEDLTGIYEYTYEFWSEFQAEKYYSELIRICELLAEYPQIGKNYNQIDLDLFGYLANKHIIFYRIVDKRLIVIVRILGADMDLKNRIKD
ncbi:type II toxin-antitoxin system RelE/ParE family toxin [Sphingobacterium corticibacter]|uniref:Toxin n=1 Tax=Sphingobacterium corticibacter TaxID=2171749 RepID=A0A2T8HMX8_9SPHI|nr:type II toxin-antitoxin system RelE/ParE family toxin [Sphingobacterium corticibacter]PVH26808.1 type II toxin-antitoxin system RelE/ParE family toxin [Sphingobacterium corticibacter]